MMKGYFIFTFVFFVFISGCASKGSYAPSGEKIVDVENALAEGDIRLTCDLGCSGKYGYNRDRLSKLYNNEAWEDLAFLVANIGFGNDQAYFYLGRAAEGLGHLTAARTYYMFSGFSKQCSATFDVCDGIKLPEQAKNRLASVRKKISEAKSEKEEAEMESNESAQTAVKETKDQDPEREPNSERYAKFWISFVTENFNSDANVDELYNLSTKFLRGGMDADSAPDTAQSLKGYVIANYAQKYMPRSQEGDENRELLKTLKENLISNGLSREEINASVNGFAQAMEKVKIQGDKHSLNHAMNAGANVKAPSPATTGEEKPSPTTQKSFRSPTKEERSLIIEGLKKTLKDPYSAQFGDIKVLGDHACAGVNAKNGFGAYTGTNYHLMGWHSELDVWYAYDFVQPGELYECILVLSKM